MKKVSIITISYNNAKGLLRTIESVVSQTYTNYEYIVIDGGSTDESKKIIESFSDKITYWVSEPDGGVYNAMNKGIEIAKGEYLHFLNSGDSYASEDVLKKTFFKEYREPLLRGIQICDYGTHQIKWENLGNREVTLYDMFVNTMLHQATFIRRDMFDKYGNYDETLKIVSDWKFFFLTILGGERTVFLDLDVVIFEMEGISTNKAHGERHLEERKRVIKELMPHNLLTDYERLRSLEQEAYIPVFIKSNKLIYFCFRALYKIFNTK
ncbi:glycosyltransferase family 2 protein [Dysgonomonas sp. GY617]|uniref:glycosyltransferase family 2 protein n=1 Tax=Dysgonomonas sp. GY617 TaxID=2780420 RepID=UPI001883338D|nr:glycosyltransferase family 2 protein [Dysgonomonas sp. GY617]MBF0575871.1 glycosyltransferase [Dysgonomonas sp. GY617]